MSIAEYRPTRLLAEVFRMRAGPAGQDGARPAGRTRACPSLNCRTLRATAPAPHR